jgi:hypothetical protein
VLKNVAKVAKMMKMVLMYAKGTQVIVLWDAKQTYTVICVIEGVTGA